MSDSEQNRAGATGHASSQGRTAGPKGEQTRQAILDAAVDRFGRDGFQRSSVAAIARDAGVSRSLAYAYFQDREALFRDALDQDVSGLLDDSISRVALEMSDDPERASWRNNLLSSLLDAIDDHPLARRALAGLEPEITGRVADLTALEDLRAAIGQRLQDGQKTGAVRPDIDPISLGRGAVNFWIGQLMAVVQFGREAVEVELTHSQALLNAAISPINAAIAPVAGGPSGSGTT